MLDEIRATSRTGHVVSLTDYFRDLDPSLALHLLLGDRPPINPEALPWKPPPPPITEYLDEPTPLPGRAAATVAPPRSRPTAKPREPQVELRLDATPVREIHVSRTAREAITAEVKQNPDIETGGYLIGRRAFSWHPTQNVPIAGTAAGFRTRCRRGWPAPRGQIPRRRLLRRVAGQLGKGITADWKPRAGGLV
jgi:hypothetical protein